MTIRQHLCVFTRYPEPGNTKTRLIPVLGDLGATRLHRRMTESTLQHLRDSLPTLSLAIYYAGGNEEKMRSWLGSHLTYYPQRGADLGQRMAHAFADGFSRGTTKIALIGTDCPDLSAKSIESGFDRLNYHDLVLGPASDGGYYLIALKRLWPELFAGIAWGTSRVLETTRTIATDLGLSVAYLPELADIDRPSDLPRIQAWLDELGLDDDRGSHLDEIE